MRAVAGEAASIEALQIGARLAVASVAMFLPVSASHLDDCNYRLR